MTNIVLTITNDQVAPALQKAHDMPSSADVKGASVSPIKFKMVDIANVLNRDSESLSLINYQDAFSYTEAWTDLSAWAVTTPVGVQVNDNKLYSIGANSGKNGINYALSLGASEHFRAVFKLNSKAGTSGSGGVIFGINTQSAGAVPASGGGSTYGMYLRNGGRPQSVENGVFSDLDAESANYSKLLNYTVTMVIDSTYISIIAVDDSNVDEIKARFLRSAVSINNLHIFNSDADALTGLSVEPVELAKAVKSFGALEFIGSRTWSGDASNNFKLYLPTGYDSRKPLKLCIGFHGNGSDENHWTTNSNGLVVREAVVNAGYAFLGCTYAANKSTWGAQESLNAYFAAYNWVKSQYPISCVVFYGNSMGGIESLLSIAEQRIPNVLAWVGTNPACSLASNYANTTFTNIINNAYNIDGGNPYATATAGHDPLLIVKKEYYGSPLLFIAADDDTVVPPSENTDLMIDYISSYSETTKIAIPSGGHSVDFSAYTAAIVDFYDSKTNG